MGQCKPSTDTCCKGSEDIVPSISKNEAKAIQAEYNKAGKPENHDHERLSLWCCKLINLAKGDASILSEVSLADALNALAVASTDVTPEGQLKDKRVGVHFANARLPEQLRRWITQEAFVHALRPLVPSPPEGEKVKTIENGAANGSNVGTDPPPDDVSALLYRIFHVLDTDRRGSMALAECSCAAAIFFGGPADEQDKALFKILDVDNSGGLSPQEFGLYVSPLVRVAILPGDLHRQEVLDQLVEQIFKQVKMNEKHEMAFEEWEQWVLSSNLAEQVEAAACHVHRSKSASGELK